MREDLVDIMRSELKEVKHALAKEREHKRDRSGVCVERGRKGREGQNERGKG
jgi:hypothetical protein